MRCKMKAMIMDMCILSHKTVFFDVRTCRRRRRGQTEGFARIITIICILHIYTYVYIYILSNFSTIIIYVQI